VGYDLRADIMSRDRDRVIAAVTDNAADILAYLTRRVDPSEDAADLLSEVLTVLWKKAGALPTKDEDIRPWMFGIARKILQHHYRTQGRQHALADRLRSMLTVTEHPGFTITDDHLDLRQALAQLSQIDRDIIGLVHWEGFTLADTSRIMGIKESTTRSRYHRAQATLRTHLTTQNEAATTEPTTPS
jgi:RNA polymerase sigma-70 factor (ECF subfamily)